MHEARAVEQHIDGADARRATLDGRGIAHIQHGGLDGVVLGGQRDESLLVDVRGVHARTFPRHGEGRGAADTLARRRDEHRFLSESFTHVVVASPRARLR